MCHQLIDAVVPTLSVQSLLCGGSVRVSSTPGGSTIGCGCDALPESVDQMGNQHSNGGDKRSSDAGHEAARNGSDHKQRKSSVTRTASGGDVHDGGGGRAALLPVEKLAKILSQKSQQEEGVHGIGQATFSKYLFPRYPVLAEKLFQYFRSNGNGKHEYISAGAFKQQCDRLFSVLDDDTVRDNLVTMFSEPDDGHATITPDGMRSMLMCAYHVSMDHYTEGPQMCLVIGKTLKAVVDSCFHAKERLSSQFVSHWLAANCPRLIVPLHRYAVHQLATSYRTLEAEGSMCLAAGLELATPVLEQPPPFGDKPPHPHLLQMSMSWLLAGALPPSYSKPQKAHSPSNSSVGLTNVNFLTKFLCSVPSHWINLYDSDEMGLGANRFLHHVLAYKGATLCLMKVEGGRLFCVAASCEWKESHLYWGGEDCCVFQLLPKFLLLEKGSKLLYLNTCVRGYPTGLRAGSDPRAPIISVDGGFEKFEFKKIPYALETIEVWGCGDQTSREVQLDIKKWQVREAERQRCVKLSADDWLDHPDRYLLELAGRPQYHQKQN